MKAFSAAFFLFFIICIVFCFVSCSSGSSSGIFVEKLTLIDAFIDTEDYGSAWKLLKKSAKHAYTYLDYLSIVRRALLLDKNSFAEKQMRKGLSVFPDNRELLAVYAHFLISLHRYDEAARYAPKLEGSAYGSVYAELRFRTAGSANNPADFLSPAYIQSYIDAAAVTGNSSYVRNAAVIYALSGDLRGAFSLHPKTMSIYENPEFWARVSYDSGNFVRCAEDLQFAKSSAGTNALLADACLRSGNEKGAVAAWIDSTENFADTNPAAWYNASRFALKTGNIGYAYSFLSSLVRIFPDYIPGLAAYGRFSVYTPIRTREHVFSSALRESGAKTLGMELDDIVPTVNPKEALALIEQSLLRRKDAALALEHLKLRWRLLYPDSFTASTEKKKAADIWKMLELQTSVPGEYEPLILHFALWFFCRYNMIDEASELFNLWCSRYAAEREFAMENGEKKDGQNDTDETQKAVVPFKENWEYDMGAYIALKQGYYERAEAILIAGVQNKNIKMTEESLLNLALLYNGSSRRIQALALYKQVSDTEIDKKLQAEIYYRIALIQREQKENRSAILSLNRALSLDPGHSRSRFMLKQLDALAE